MTRHDLRLVFAIVSTAALASAGSVLLSHALEAPAPQPIPPAPPPPVDLAPLEQRISALETRVTALEPDTTCDEVSCVLNNYEGRCCAQFRQPMRDVIDRDIIATGVAAMRAKFVACGDHSSAKGRVRVHVKVAPDGTVSSVLVTDSPDAALASCVANVMKTATFAQTHDGGSFAYPFVF